MTQVSNLGHVRRHTRLSIWPVVGYASGDTILGQTGEPLDEGLRQRFLARTRRT